MSAKAESGACAPRLSDDGTVLPRAAATALGALLLRAVLDALETAPDLAGRVRNVLGSAQGGPQGSRFATVAEYAALARVSTKTIRYYVQNGMVEGEHFHREGRTGRRVILHVPEADEWRIKRRPAQQGERALEDFANDDLLRRRALVALRNGRRTG